MTDTTREVPTGQDAGRVTYTNRRGTTYFLGRTTTKRGKPRYAFALAPRGEPVERIPEGWEIVESVNGVVSLRKAGPKHVSDFEVQVAREAVARHAQRPFCRVELEKDAIVVFEPAGMVTSRAPAGAAAAAWAAATAAEVQRRIRFQPAVRFVLEHPGRRTFQAQRMCYRGGREGWWSVGAPGPLAKVARIVEHIGRDTFFDLM